MPLPWKERALNRRVEVARAHFGALLITGPRQAGKSSLLQHLFRNVPVLRLDDLVTLKEASEDPLGMLDRVGEPVILDEVQMAGHLFSYLKLRLDAGPQKKGRFALTRSQTFSLMQGVTESLAGRLAILELLPFSWRELYPQSLEMQTPQVWQQIWRGFFPATQEVSDMAVREWMSAHLMSVVERDLRSLHHITDLGRFQSFLELLALRCGQVLNLNEVAKEAQISHGTARDWLTMLEAGYLIKLVQPWYRNLSKRIVKAPKLHFVDTGLICYLLHIRSAEELARHPLRGHVFENMVAMEALKNSRGNSPRL